MVGQCLGGLQTAQPRVGGGQGHRGQQSLKEGRKARLQTPQPQQGSMGAQSLKVD